MDQVLRFFRPLLTLNYKYPYAVISFCLVTSILGAYFAVHLKVDTDLAELLPPDNPHVQTLDSLKNTIGNEAKLDVAITSPSFKDNVRFAQDLIKNSLQLVDNETNQPFFDQGEYKRNADFLKNNALYFATSKELDEINSYLNQKIQNSNKKANPFLVNFEEPSKKDTSKDKLKEFQKTYNTLVPSEYTISADSTILLMSLRPTGSKTNLDFLERMFSKFDSLTTAMKRTSKNKNIDVYYSGHLRNYLQQITNVKKDVFDSFATGITSVILLVLFYFFIKKYLNYRRGAPEDRTHGIWAHILRMPVSILVIGIPLIFSLTWTFGITYGVLGRLTTLTSVLFVILFGMGIDYGIHFYARYIEIRSEGNTVEASLFRTYDTSGGPIIVSGLTTALSLYVLMFARFRGFSEFGFIAGTGIIFALLFMLFALPSLLVIFERWNWLLINTNIASQGKYLRQRYPFSKTIVLTGMILSVIVLLNLRHLQFQYNFGKLEPTNKVSQKFYHIAGQARQSHKRNPAYLLADNRAQVEEIADTLRHRMRQDTTSPTIRDVEALPERFPVTAAQKKAKLNNIDSIRTLLNEPVIKNKNTQKLNELRQAAQTRHPIRMNQIPDYFTNKFTTKQGKIGNFVIVYPSMGLSDSRNSIAFTHDVGEVTLASGKKVYAGSTSIIGSQIIQLLQHESPWLVGATLLMVFLLMFLSFRSLRWTLIALLPLIVGLLFLFGIMMLTGMMLNLYNLVVLPAILGVGEDNGVHVASRYREEGPNSMRKVLSSTGQHISIGSITTMLGFSGLIFTNHPGLQSLGWMAVIGIGMTLFTALTFLPALIQWLEDRNWIQYGGAEV